MSKGIQSVAQLGMNPGIWLQCLLLKHTGIEGRKL